jgi:hypothetical protein
MSCGAVGVNDALRSAAAVESHYRTLEETSWHGAIAHREVNTQIENGTTYWKPR